MISPPMTAPARALIIKPSSLGDVVTALPVLRGLRRTFPQAHIAWLIGRSYAPLLEGDGDLDEMIIFDRARFGPPWHWPLATGELVRLVWQLRAGKFDWVIDLQGLLRSGLLAMVTGAPVRAGFADAREGAAFFYTHPFAPDAPHTVDRNINLAQRLGIDARGEDMTLRIAPAAREYAADILSRHGLSEKGFLAVVPPTRWPTKRYPVRHWRTVLTALARQCPVAILGGGGEEKDYCAAVAEGLGDGVVNLAGRTTIPRMAAVIAASRGVVCGDSAANFIATAVGVEVVTLLGPTRMERTGPYLHGRSLMADIPCRGCLKKRCHHVTCMESIPPAEVVAAALIMLK